MTGLLARYALSGAVDDVSPKVAILSFQSRVVWGHVGNSVAEFALRRAGVDVWPIDTVCLSHHPGHGRCRGRVREPEELAELVIGLEDIGALAQCRAVLSGYLGSWRNGGVVLDAVARLGRARPDALFCCDPVMGDHDVGFYVDEALIRFFRDQAVAAADILMPNHFELQTLAQAELPTLPAVLAAADRLRRQGPKVLLVSSLPDADAPSRLGTLLMTAGETWLATTPRLPMPARGAGDLLAAQFLARWLRDPEPPQCLAGAVAATFAVLAATGDAPELRLVAAQQQMAAPPLDPVVLRRLR